MLDSSAHDLPHHRYVLQLGLGSTGRTYIAVNVDAVWPRSAHAIPEVLLVVPRRPFRPARKIKQARLGGRAWPDCRLLIERIEFKLERIRYVYVGGPDHGDSSVEVGIEVVLHSAVLCVSSAPGPSRSSLARNCRPGHRNHEGADTVQVKVSLAGDALRSPRMSTSTPHHEGLGRGWIPTPSQADAADMYAPLDNIVLPAFGPQSEGVPPNATAAVSGKAVTAFAPYVSCRTAARIS